MLSDPQVQDIATLIDRGFLLLFRANLPERINDEASLGTGKGTKRQMSKNSKLYAVKSNFNQLLDVARATHAENVADIMESGSAVVSRADPFSDQSLPRYATLHS